ncbi:MAG: NgoPII family restriction endonuclease [Hormoscilla sp. SP5CHS1]|nr:NgoPII family restriction endonuclease [Hormoscilla sp. SP12CHS1]MBC6453834.1 NgoPII family restriction endonuclease [Hormoscilla sp. SP5CHS1]
MNEENEQKRVEAYSEVFDYQGNPNNPPDIILKKGDAVEIKKIESLRTKIALNSSYPKSKLLPDNPTITKYCGEDWT